MAGATLLLPSPMKQARGAGHSDRAPGVPPSLGCSELRADRCRSDRAARSGAAWNRQLITQGSGAIAQGSRNKYPNKYQTSWSTTSWCLSENLAMAGTVPRRGDLSFFGWISLTAPGARARARARRAREGGAFPEQPGRIDVARRKRPAGHEGGAPFLAPIRWALFFPEALRKDGWGLL